MTVLEAVARGQVEGARERAWPGEEVVVVADAHVHRGVTHELAERPEDVAVEQRRCGDEVGVVSGRHRELRPLGGEQPANGPLVVVTGAVVGEHGEAQRTVERARAAS